MFRVERTHPHRPPIVVLFALLSAIAGPASAQAVRVVGRVLDQQNNRPVNGATVRFETGSYALTDERGWFVVDGVEPGEHRIVVEMIGYERREEALRIQVGQVNELRLTISQQPISLEPIDVTVRSGWLEANGFYERERNGAHGEFIDRRDIERKQPDVLTDLLRDVPGVRIYYLEAGRKHVRLNRGGSSDLAAFDPRQDAVRPGCEPDLYIDGQPYRERIPRDGTENTVDGFDIIVPSMIEGMEVYSGSSAPLQYQSSCGTILIWTRRGASRTMATPQESASPAAAGPFVAAPCSVAPAIDAGARVRHGRFRAARVARCQVGLHDQRRLDHRRRGVAGAARSPPSRFRTDHGQFATQTDLRGDGHWRRFRGRRSAGRSAVAVPSMGGCADPLNAPSCPANIESDVIPLPYSPCDVAAEPLD